MQQKYAMRVAPGVEPRQQEQKERAFLPDGGTAEGPTCLQPGGVVKLLLPLSHHSVQRSCLLGNRNLNRGLGSSGSAAWMGTLA